MMDRRAFLKATLAVPAFTFSTCSHHSEAPSFGALDDQYLAKGLNALARSARGNYFEDGHKGTALIRAWLFSRENPLPAESVVLLNEWLAFNVRGQALYDDHSPGEAGGSVREIVGALDERADQLQEVGHNVIFAAAALRAMQDAPHLATPAVCRGVCLMLRRFKRQGYSLANEEMCFPVAPGPRDLSAFICRELPAAARQWEGRGNGYTGHMLTFGHAIVELFELGHADVARKSLKAYERFVRRVRYGPSPGDGKRPDPETAARPLQPEFWSPRRNTTMGLGHTVKYLSSFYSVLKTAKDPATRDALLQASHHLF